MNLSPLPWHIEEKPIDVWDGAGLLVHRGIADFGNDDQWNRASDNARLIAAAPDLLAACKAMVDAFDGMGHRLSLLDEDQFITPDEIEAANLGVAAIAKAEGRAT